MYFSTLNGENKTTCSLEGYNRYLNSKLTVRNSHKHLYKFVSIVNETNLDRLDDIEEFGNRRRVYSMDKDYADRIATLQGLVKSYKDRKTNDEKLRYLDAIVSVQMWQYLDDPDLLDGEIDGDY